MRRAARTPSSVCVGGIRMSMTATSGCLRAIAPIRLDGVPDLGGDLEAGVGEDARDALADQRGVVGDHDLHAAALRTASPERSPFGTKPCAGDSSTIGP